MTTNPLPNEAATPAVTVEKEKKKAPTVKKKQEVATVQSKAAAPAVKLPTGLPATDTAMSAAAGMMGIIERLANDPSVDLDKMERFLNMQLALMDRMAQAAYTRDFAAMSQVLPRITKRGSVGYKEDKNDKNSATVEAFKFASFEDIDTAVRPILPQYGFSISFTTKPREGGGLIMIGTLSHREGHKTTCELPLAIDTSGGKNNLQGMGSTASYGVRYCHQILLNLVRIGADTDGAGDPPEPITTEQAVELDQALREKEKIVSEEKRAGLRARFLAHMGVEDIREITDYAVAKNAIASIGAKSKANIKK